MMFLNLLRASDNDNMILLQNEDWLFIISYLKGTLHHYEMKIVFFIRLLEEDPPLLPNDVKKGLDFYTCFYMSSMQLQI